MKSREKKRQTEKRRTEEKKKLELDQKKPDPVHCQTENAPNK